jgi:hypothetical protein
VRSGHHGWLYYSHRDPGILMILLWLILTPIVGGVLAGFSGRRNNALSRWLSLACLAIDLVLIVTLWAAHYGAAVTSTGHGLLRSIGRGSRNSASGFISDWMAWACC